MESEQHDDELLITAEPASGSWLAPRLSGWGTVRSTVPAGFEAYARILHPASASRVVDGLDGMEVPSAVAEESWTWSRAAQLFGGVVHPLVQWGALAGDLYGQVEAGGWRVSPPGTGRATPDLFGSLARDLLAESHAGMPVTLALWAGWGALHPGSSSSSVIILHADLDEHADPVEYVDPAASLSWDTADTVSPVVADAIASGERLRLPGRDYIVLATTLGALAHPRWLVRAGIGWGWGSGPLPQLIWPADHGWCVAFEIDYDSTLVGGSRRLIDRLLASSDLEAFEVSPDGDLSSTGDTVNEP